MTDLGAILIPHLQADFSSGAGVDREWLTATLPARLLCGELLLIHEQGITYHYNPPDF